MKTRQAPQRGRIIGELGGVDRYSRSVSIVASTPQPVEGEAITSWDLARFTKNPVILWAHDSGNGLVAPNLPVGTATDVRWDPAVGLLMTVNFARKEANPLAEQVFQGCIDGIVRAVSVGYDHGEQPDGTVTGGEEPPPPGATARLMEVSFVPIGADEDAGTPELNPDAEEADPAEPTDEEMRAKVSAAAAELARHRARIKRAVADFGKPRAKVSGEVRTDKGDHPTVVNRMDRGPIRLDRAEDTPSGGKRIPARLSRTGVLSYMNGDGTVRRELRLAEEIFRADSLATLEDAVVIDIAHHTGMVDPKSWKKSSLGHVKNVRRDGSFIAATLVVNDGATLDSIAAGDRTEISCGYRCRLDWTPGTHDGEEYDCIQRDIRYNHAALCPPNRGRAGPEVGLRLDENNVWAVAHFDNDPHKETIMVTKIRLDGKEYEEGSREHLDAVERIHSKALEKLEADTKVRLDALVVEKVDLQKKLDAADGAHDATKKELDTVKLDAKKAADKGEADKAEWKKDESKRIAKRVRLMRMALRFFDDDKDMDEKMDGMTDNEIRLAVIKKRDDKFDAKDRSEDYVESRFDTICDLAKDDRGVNGVARLAQNLQLHVDAADGADDPVSKARAKRDDQALNAWKTTPANGAAGK